MNKKSVATFQIPKKALNTNITVANRLNGAPLPEPYWPPRIVDSGISRREMLSNLTEIHAYILWELKST